MAETIDFHYAQPAGRLALVLPGIGLIGGIALMVLIHPAVGLPVLLACILGSNIWGALQKRCTGSLLLEEDGCVLRTGRREHRLHYRDIRAIAREYYDDAKSTAGIGYTQANPNGYRIELRHADDIVFRVDPQEEKTFYAAMQAYNRTVYGTRLVSVSHRIDEAAVRQREAQTPLPQQHYSLTAALAALAARSGVPIEDRTAGADPNPRRQRQR